MSAICARLRFVNLGWQYTGTDKPMTLTNGYGDWNESFATYREGSALH